MKHTRDARPDPREMLPEISEGSAKVVRWMMAIEPEKRPQSAEALVAEIGKLLPTLPESNSAMRPAYNVSASDAPMGAPPPNSSLTDDVELMAKPVSSSSVPTRPMSYTKTKTPPQKMGLWQRIVASVNMLLGR
jgi:serine/threonine protein kinase